MAKERLPGQLVINKFNDHEFYHAGDYNCHLRDRNQGGYDIF